VMPRNKQELERIKSAPGVKEISPVTNQVYKVATSTTDLDTAISTVRSEAYNTVAHRAYKPKDSTATVYYLTDTIIVRFSPETDNKRIEDILAKYSLNVLKEYEGQENTYLVRVTTQSGENPIKISNRLAEEEGVVFAEPNMVNRFSRMFIPKDSYFRRQWHLMAKDKPQCLAAASVNAPEAWDVTRGERNIVVAVIDDGFDISHPDFTGEGKIVAPRDYVDGDANPFPEEAHGDYHGTPCAGVAVAESNGRGVVGVAHGCAFMPIRFDLSADDDLLIEIFTEASRYADVISCSWGPPPAYVPVSTAISDMMHTVATTGGPRGKGCVICIAAGNFNAPLNDPNEDGFHWADYDGRKRVTLEPILNGFAAHPDVLAVAASTSMNRHAEYSNWGNEVCVCAPSNNFCLMSPTTAVQGLGIWTTDNEKYGTGFTGHSRYTGEFGGTSSATPLAAGVCALVLSANPNLTAAEVKEIIQQTADKIMDGNPDVMGACRGEYNDGHSQWFGWGKINAAKAVAEAKRRL